MFICDSGMDSDGTNIDSCYVYMWSGMDSDGTNIDSCCVYMS